MSTTDRHLRVLDRPRRLDGSVLDRTVEGHGIGEGWTLGEVIGASDRASLLVFLRHYG